MRPTWLLLLVTSCADSKEGPGDSAAQAQCVTDETCGDESICAGGTCVPGDRDNSLEEATAILWEDEVEAALAPDGDADWFSVEATGGEFVRVATTVEDEELLDTVVSVYDATGHRITWEDEHPMSNVSGLDSVAYAYFPTAGTYYILVEQASAFYGEGATGVDYAAYSIAVIDYDAAPEDDALDDPAFDLDTLSGNTWYSIPLLVGSDGDVDYATWEMPYTNAPISIAAMSNDETSEATPSIALYNSAGELVLTMDDPDVESYARLPDALDTRYTLALADEDGEGGDLHWTWVFLILRDEGDPNPRETEPNESIETASSLVLADQEPDSGTWYAAFGGGWLDPVDDQDVWEVELPSDDLYLTVAFGAQTYGGQLVGRVEVLDAAGTVLSTVDSTVGDDATTYNLGPYPAGPVYVRLSAAPDTIVPAGEGAFYQFGVHLTSDPVD